MKDILSPSELENIELAMNLGWHIVPYNGKTPRIKWGSEHRKHLTSMDQVLHYSKTQRSRMGFVLSTASATLIDIDVPLALKTSEANGRDTKEHKQDVKAEWKSWNQDDKEELLYGMRDLAVKAGLPPHCDMLSSSKSGWHGYYHCKSRKSDPTSLRRYLTEISETDECIEIFANWRMAYVTDWTNMDGVINAEPIDYKKVADFWGRMADKLNGYRTLRRQVVHAPPPPLIQQPTGKWIMDYEAYVNKSAYAQTAIPNRLFTWAVKAFQLDDLDGVMAAEQDARMNGMTEAKIRKQIKGARDFASTHPDPRLHERTAYANFTI